MVFQTNSVNRAIQISVVYNRDYTSAYRAIPVFLWLSICLYNSDLRVQILCIYNKINLCCLLRKKIIEDFFLIFIELKTIQSNVVVKNGHPQLFE